MTSSETLSEGYVDFHVNRLMSAGPCITFGRRPRRSSTAGRIAETMLESALPVLKQGNYRIVLPESEQYNCIAWAAGDETRWWHPFAARDVGPRCAAHGLSAHCFWPRRADDAHEMTNYLFAFERLGYRVCTRSFDPVVDPVANAAEIERIALYQHQNDPGCSHAARQLPSGVWTSKVNDLAGVAHLSPRDLEGEHGGYGRVALYMARPRQRTAVPDA